MNREGEPPDDGATPIAPADDDNVIAFPGARVRSLPSANDAAPPEPAAPATDTSPTEDPGMTLDAFERAVRSAVREKLGDSPDGRAQGADELVAQVFSALTGKDAKSALSEVRARLSEPVTVEPAPREGDVIDLGAVREARQRASLESAQKLGGALKDTFAQFLAGIAQRQGGSAEITLDSSFFRQHGSSLLGNLFQGLASALMQQNQPPKPPPAPMPADETPVPEPVPVDAESGAPLPPGTPPPAPQPTPSPRQVSVKLDLGSILAGLFRRRETPPDPKPTE